MAINEEATGQNSVAITGTATGENSLGVHGKGDAVGIRGDGKTWHGVVGFSESTTGGAGVYGEAVGPGVTGVSKTWHGVYGETPSTTGGAGVWGEHKGAGSGVVGVSNSGAGVYGKGRIAGLFDGDVEITGNLTIQGVSIQIWLQRIIALEREVVTLRQQLASHSHSGGGGTTPSKPVIDSVTKQGSDEFQVKGNGFLKSHAVQIRVTNTATFAGNFFQATSDSSGNLDATLNTPPQAAGTVLAFSANDERSDPNDITGTLWSNTFNITV